MHIINIMLGKGRGGIEQAFLDYNALIGAAGHRVTAIMHPESWARGECAYPSRYLANLGQWDVFARRRLRRMLRELSPDVVIAHGNRAIGLATAAKSDCPVIGVAHNYKIRRFDKLDAAFCITRDLEKKLMEQTIHPSRIHAMPNIITCDVAVPKAAFRQTPLIGSLGRFVAKKGFDRFLKALAHVRDRGHDFQVRLGGDGEEKEALQNLCAELELENIVTFTGWVNDRFAFLRELDVFCLPSLHEPFGIVLLEAFASGLPTVATSSEGPSEIATDCEDALLVPIDDPVAIADALERLLLQPALAATLAKGATKTARRYGLTEGAARFDAALQIVVAQHSAAR